MKKIIKSAALVALFVSTMALGACSIPFIEDDTLLEKLSTPTLSVKVDEERVILESSKNDNASVYQFGVYSGFEHNRISAYITLETTNYSYDVTEYITEPRIYYFYVRLIGDNEIYKNSDISEIINIENSSRLETPDLEINDMILSWMPVLYASEYYVYVNDVHKITTTNTVEDISYLIDGSHNEAYSFEVMAVFNSDDNELDNLDNSFKSNLVLYNEHLKLDDITGLGITNETLSWDSVQGAVEYIVYIDDEPFITVENFFDFDTYLVDAKSYRFDLEVVGESHIIPPDIAGPIYYDNYLQLEAPKNVILVVSDDNIEISWDPVHDALSYSVLIDGIIHLNDFGNPEQVLINKYSLPIDYYTGDISIAVRANPYGYFLESEASDHILFDGYGELETPIGLTYNEGILSWESVLGAENYTVYLNNYNYNVIDNSFNVHDNAPYEGVFQARVMADATYNNASEITEYIFINNTDNYKEGFTDSYFFYTGFNDFYITSQEDLNKVVFYAITNNIDSIDIYVSIEDPYDIEDMHLHSIHNFPESKSYSYFQPQTLNDNEYRLSYTYSGPDGPIYSTGFSEIALKHEGFQPKTSIIGRGENFDDFPIDNSLMETIVYNTNMLYNAVQMGVKPLFESEDSDAYIIYEIARDILRDIIDNDMSDYQKILAIHDYIVSTTSYDKEVYINSLDPTFDSTKTTLYDAFFIEGVFFNNKAVCDGIAKAFSLLAGIEGIEAVKVTGTANSSNTGPTQDDIGHAWNKVYLDADGTGHKWFIIDATWGIKGIIIEDDSFEIISHAYFLLTDNDVSNSHFAGEYSNPPADYDVDYFEIQSWYEEVSIKINSQGDLNDLIDYVILNDIEGIEFSMPGTVSQVHGSLNDAIDNRISSFRFIADSEKEIYYVIFDFS